MLAVGASVGVGRAQTVRPVIVEYKGSAKGKLELVNNSFQPTNVVIEPRSFTIKEDGDGIYGPLAKDIHLKLSSMSLRIPPKQSRYVFYEAKADSLPAGSASHRLSPAEGAAGKTGRERGISQLSTRPAPGSDRRGKQQREVGPSPGMAGHFERNKGRRFRIPAASAKPAPVGSGVERGRSTCHFFHTLRALLL